MSVTKLFLLNRSAPPSSGLLECVKRCGFELLHLPLVHARLVDPPTHFARDHVWASDWLIFCSPRAVEFAAQQLPGIWELDAQFAAVGTSSARCIRAQSANKTVLAPVEGDGANALLQCQALHAVAGSKVSIVTGRGGLDELETTLAKRGAHVQRVELYERVHRELDPDQRERCQSADFAFVGSAEFLNALLAARAGKALPVWVPSARVAAYARRNGCAADLCADSTDGALIARLSQFLADPSKSFGGEQIG